MDSSQDINMVIDPLENLFDIGDNYDEVRGRSLEMSAHKPRSSSISSSKCDEEYHIQVKRESDRMVEDEPVNSIGSICIKYATQEGQNNQVSKVADSTSNTRQQCVPTVNLPLTSLMVNIQLNYDSDQALDPESWDGNFRAVSLHEFIEHLASDALNIKESLLRMRKYISDKSIDGDKAHEVEDLKGMGKAMWGFISTIYESHWDSLFVDDNKMTFRNKVRSKFIPQVMKSQVPNKGKEVVKPTFVSSLLPPILAKSTKEVKEISKYFKKNNKSLTKKSYAQASSSKQAPITSSLNIVMNTLKIKETFSYLSNKKIDMIQKVINGSDNKPKLKIIMTTKSLSRKQVIVPMNKDLSKRFTKDVSTHVININRSLKNIYSNTIADFIYTDDKEVIITTNNIASNSDLQEIEKYIKNSLSNNEDSITSARLSQSKSYLKIVGISYFVDNSNTHISSEDIEHILKNNHIVMIFKSFRVRQKNNSCIE